MTSTAGLFSTLWPSVLLCAGCSLTTELGDLSNGSTPASTDAVVLGRDNLDPVPSIGNDEETGLRHEPT